jgi:two-component system sensor histidine kinase BaeS
LTMRTLRGRFVLSHILPLLLIVPLVSIGLTYVLETQVLLKDLAQGIAEEADLIVEALDSNSEIWFAPDRAEAFAARFGVRVKGQVFLLHPDGSLLASSSPEYTDHRGQPLDLEGMDTAIGGERSVLVSHGWFEQSAEVLVPVTGIKQQLVGIVAVTRTLQGMASQFGRLRQWVLAILVVELILGAVIGLLLALRLERPIGRVATAIIDVANGKRVEPIPEQGPQEIIDLSAAVNTLVDRLRSLEEMRRRSLANIVHELGRPLGAVRAAIHVLRYGAADDPDIREELLEGIENEVKRMQPLLDDLAQLHGHVVGTLELAYQSIPISAWLPSLLIPWRAAALDKGLHWQETIPPDLPTLKLDPNRMAQAIGNLLSNAVKYTPVSGNVSLTGGGNDMEVWIQVGDTGPGIVPEEQERIFEPFYRGRQARRFPQGLGLGLTIARDVVNAHGGRLDLTSTPGEGSRFTIYLPHRPD